MPPVTAGSEASRIIARGSWSAGLGFAVRLGARLVFLFIAGRLFGASLFGAFALAVAVVELAVTVAGLGTKRTLFQFLDERDPARPPGHVVLDAALLVLLVGILLAAGIAALILLLPAFLVPPDTAFALLVLAPAIAGQSLLDLFSAATRWRHLIRYEVIGRSIVEPYFGVAGTIFFYLLGFEREGLLAGYWMGTLAALVYVLAGARRALGGFAFTAWRAALGRLAAMLHGSAANTANEFLNALYGRLDLYLVGILLGEGGAGVYGMARQVRTPIRQVRQSFDGLLTPIVARTLAATGPVGTGRALASAARLILVIQLPLLILLAALGRPLLSAIGPGFAPGYWALICLAAAESIQGAFGLGDLIFVYRRPKLGLWITFFSILVGVASGLIFIPLWGVTGAGLSVLLSYGVRALHRRHVLAGRFGVSVPVTHSFWPLAAALAGIAASAAVVRWAGPLSIPLYAGAAASGLAAYALILFAWLRLTGNSLAIAGFIADRFLPPDGDTEELLEEQVEEPRVSAAGP
jgi:O-antigen/teichoic acid export membrane protein